MRIKYLIFFDTITGKGNTEIKVNWKERIKGIDNIKKIEKEIGNKEHTTIVINNYKYIGLAWK